MPSERPFDIDRALSLVRSAVQGLPKPALFALADEGYLSPFEQLVACIISVRTRDEVALPAARDFLRRAHTPEQVSRLLAQEIDKLLHPVSFHGPKSLTILEAAHRARDRYDGQVPCDYDELIQFKGVGPKCANAVLSIACGKPAIVVDVHVHRVVNAWGYVHTATPEQTLRALEAKLPQRYWAELNRLLIPFDKYVCRPGQLDRLSPELRALCPSR